MREREQGVHLYFFVSLFVFFHGQHSRCFVFLLFVGIAPYLSYLLLIRLTNFSSLFRKYNCLCFNRQVILVLLGVKQHNIYIILYNNNIEHNIEPTKHTFKIHSQPKKGLFQERET